MRRPGRHDRLVSFELALPLGADRCANFIFPVWLRRITFKHVVRRYVDNARTNIPCRRGDTPRRLTIDACGVLDFLFRSTDSGIGCTVYD